MFKKREILYIFCHEYCTYEAPVVHRIFCVLSFVWQAVFVLLECFIVNLQQTALRQLCSKLQFFINCYLVQHSSQQPNKGKVIHQAIQVIKFLTDKVLHFVLQFLEQHSNLASQQEFTLGQAHYLLPHEAFAIWIVNGSCT